MDKVRTSLKLGTPVCLNARESKQITFVCSVFRKPGGTDMDENGIQAEMRPER